MARVKKRTYFKDDKNRFRLLRYTGTDDLLDRPSLTIDDICQKTGLSKGLVAKMEKQQLNNGDVPSCNASTIRAFHDNLGCSYEYLMGNTNCKSPEYYHLGSDPILGSLPDNFWNNLKYVLTDEFALDKNYIVKERVATMRLLLNNPESFRSLLDAIFNSLFEIYKYKKSPLPDYMIQDHVAQREYALDQIFNRFLAQNLLPNMDLLFQKHEEDMQSLKEQENDIMAHFGQGLLKFIEEQKDTDIGE